ncbi:hypothetical protein BKA82DRAFT_136450 [Pisolithus tinctorius]|uniref:Uncharacterized protein n=1 Tax=Pisolithus tinctorius Marx 270 TaxID=870435 RepID=A0A0C3PHB8_PISTI|nr:hypothetical protein BKA82DRAFT_136450 [Pisolithus tinctorius]KIO07384.1 hypothetical protein M404DRAFT_136450 [Pisolithus tinctorius Marx 270]
MNWDHQGSLFYPTHDTILLVHLGHLLRVISINIGVHYSNVIRVYVQHNQTLKKSAFSHPLAVSPTHT